MKADAAWLRRPTEATGLREQGQALGQHAAGGRSTRTGFAVAADYERLLQVLQAQMSPGSRQLVMAPSNSTGPKAGVQARIAPAAR